MKLFFLVEGLKRLLIHFFSSSLWIILGPCSLFAVFSGNPAEPALETPGIHLTTGYIRDYTKNLSMEQEGGDLNDPKTSLKNLNLHLQLAEMSFVLMQRFELMGFVGGGKERAMETPDALFSFDFDSSYHLCWGVKVRAALVKCMGFCLAADATFLNLPSSPQSVFKFFERWNLPLNLSPQEFSIRQWQVGGALSLALPFFSPYIGMNYLRTRLHIEKGDIVPAMDYRNCQKVGYMYGVTLLLSSGFHVNFEKREGNETGYMLSTRAIF